MYGYIPRILSYLDGEGIQRTVRENDLELPDGSMVVLGEPGMGKSKLLESIGKATAVSVVSAIDLRISDIPENVKGHVLIDGLDELSERQEGDALAYVLRKLKEAGWPNFVLSCRAADWSNLGVTDIAQATKTKPILYTLEPFDRNQIIQFVRSEAPLINAERMVDQLAKHDLGDLLGNPLTLGLFAKIAKTGESLPRTKSKLFARACELLVAEQNPQYENSTASQRPQDILNAGAAVCASMLVCGAGAVTTLSAARARIADLRVGDARRLRGAKDAALAVKTRLFRPLGSDGRFTYIHRVVAEYLGATWLSAQASDPISSARILGLFSSLGVVPASLRGVHAWLGRMSHTLARPIIQADPFGFLRYADADDIPADQARILFDALNDLADDNPFFRAGDWSKRSLAGLMRPELADDIERIISDPEPRGHLRSLLLEGLVGSGLVEQLRDTLFKIVRSRAFYYSDRSDAADALLASDINFDRRVLLDQLRSMGDEDSCRLAENLLEKCDYNEIGAQGFVDVMLSYTGMTVCPLQEPEPERALMVRDFEMTVRGIPFAAAPKLLDVMAPYLDAFLQKVSVDAQLDLSKLVLALVRRAFLEGERDPPRIWTWLAPLLYVHDDFVRGADPLKKLLDDDQEFRLALYSYISFEAKTARIRPDFIFLHGSPLAWLVPTNEMDIADLLKQMAGMDNQAEHLRETWTRLVLQHARGEPLHKSLHDTTRTFAGNDPELNRWLSGIIAGDQPEWKERNFQIQKQQRLDREKRFEEIRSKVRANLESVRAGDFRYLYAAAKAYLGRFSDVKSERGGRGRLEVLYGSDLVDDILNGIDSYLTEKSVLDFEQVSQSLSEGNYPVGLLPMLAAGIERMRLGKSFNDIPDAVAQLLFRVSFETWVYSYEGDSNELSEALFARVIKSDDDKTPFLRTMVEPSLKMGKPHPSGLYRLKSDSRWQAQIADLAIEWLRGIDEISDTAEIDLIDLLILAGRWNELSEIALQRLDSMKPTDNRRLTWLSTLFLTSFDQFAGNFQGEAAGQRDFLWAARARTSSDRDPGRAMVTVDQAYFLVSSFRNNWENVDFSSGYSRGDTNPWDAANFMRFVLERLAKDTTQTAQDAILRLAGMPRDSYTDLIKMHRSEQERRIAEANYQPPTIFELSSIIARGEPASFEDLRATVLAVLDEFQLWLRGDETSPVRHFWPKNAQPLLEEPARDLTKNLLRAFIEPLGISMVTEKRMVEDKRVDLTFRCGEIELPVEFKGQWNKELWDAASTQLYDRYTKDPRGGNAGIYIVLWYGHKAPSGRKLRTHPDKEEPANTPDDLHASLVQRVPGDRKAAIDIVVLDLS